MSNTITAYFKGRVGVAESVYQNDYGIVMAFDSIDLPAHFDCYFSRLNQEEALPGLGADNRVTIPNSILANPGNVTIHIPLHTGEDDSEVEYVIYFKVIGRARPIDDGTPAQMTAIERALALLSQPITNIEEIVNEALSFTGDTFAEMKQELADDFAEYKGDVDDDIADFKTEIRGDIADVEHDFDILDGQFQTAVAAITVDSEVQGIRTGDDGVTYTSAGEAVRKQFSDVKSALTLTDEFVFEKESDRSIYASVAGWRLNESDGLCTANADYQMVKYEVKAGDFLYIDTDDRFQFQTGAAVNTWGTSAIIGHPYTGAKYIFVPQGTTPIYLIISTKISGGHYECKDVKGIKLIDVADDVEILKEYALVMEKSQEVSLTGVTGIVSKSGSINTGDSGFTHYFVDVSEDEVYSVTSFEQGNENYPFAIYYDANNAIVGFVETGSTGAMATKEVRIPNGVSKICINGYNAVTTATKCYLLEPVDTKEYIDDAVANSYWKGKKIVWFGTSIPAGVVNAGDSGGNGAYPTRVGEKIGATVYNESIGSSRMRGGSYHHITADDPMGWAGIEMIGLMYSFTLSTTEKQGIMDDWDDKWSDIIPDLPAPSNYNPSNAASYLASSWDVILPKYLSGGAVGQCDLYVFDHGYNDGVVDYGFSDLSDVPASAEDRTYWFGAMNYIVKKILEDNPKAHILVIGHYNNYGDQFNRGANWNQHYVCEAQDAYATMWGLNCVPTWRLLGLSMQKITVGGVEKTMIAARYPDALHPASDSTGKELQRYAEALTPYVEMQR